MSLKLYNSLSRKIEDFVPINPELVTMYTCGPTVYYYQTIGNFRTVILSDIVHRVILFNDYKVRHVSNFTDVGHLNGDHDDILDPNTGEDKIELQARKESKSAKEITDYYIDDYKQSLNQLNIKSRTFTRATEYIKEQIDMIQVLEKKGFTYRTSDGIYFDASKFSAYGDLSGYKANQILEGARVDINSEKRNPNDFALWKFSKPEDNRLQEYESPWGVGFPGWHIECSAMAIKELGVSIDIHIGGEDLRMIHHQNEIAQSECATGEKFANFWVHGAFLQVDGGRMGKSLGNAYTMQDLVANGVDPLAYRYLCLTAHYRSPLNFTWESVNAAQNALHNLYSQVEELKEVKNSEIDSTYHSRFKEALNEDLNLPRALAVVWDMLKSGIPDETKVVTLAEFDKVLGLNLLDHVGFVIPKKVEDLAKTRDAYRKAGIWDKADIIRKEIDSLGYLVEDTKSGYKLKRKI
jgi:cysteinyl-tRNA synthetase